MSASQTMVERLRMIRGVLFDFYGTLARPVAWGDTHEEVFARHGLVFDQAAWSDRWVGGALDGEEHFAHSADAESYRAWELERLRQRASAAGVGDDDLDALVADLHSATKDFTLAAYGEVPGVLAQLREWGVVVAVCSNWDWHLQEALAACGLGELVDVAVTSAQAGVRKPHPHIYDLTLRSSGLIPGEALFVGDTWGPDVQGPLRHGMRAVHVLRPERDPGPEGAPPVPAGALRVEDLTPVPELVGTGVQRSRR